MGRIREKLYSFSLKLSKTKWDTTILFIFAVADASFLPLPVTTFFLVLILLNKTKSLKYILSVTLGTMAGALAGYTFGRYAVLNANGEAAGVLNYLFDYLPGFSENSYNKIHLLYSKWDYWILCIAAYTPLPYGLFSITSGIFEINIIIFCFTTFVSQGIKFLILAFLTLKSTPEIKKSFWFKRKSIAGITTIIILTAEVAKAF